MIYNVFISQILGIVGTFRCVASNPVGEVRTVCNLTVVPATQEIVPTESQAPAYTVTTVAAETTPVLHSTQENVSVTESIETTVRDEVRSENTVEKVLIRDIS